MCIRTETTIDYREDVRRVTLCAMGMYSVRQAPIKVSAINLWNSKRFPVMFGCGFVCPRSRLACFGILWAPPAKVNVSVDSVRSGKAI